MGALSERAKHVLISLRAETPKNLRHTDKQTDKLSVFDALTDVKSASRNKASKIRIPFLIKNRERGGIP